MSEKKVGKRLLTWVLVLVMTLSLLPLNVLAAENDTPENTNPSIERSEETLGAYLVKSATKDGDTYKIQLESWVTGKAEQTTGSAPLDIVLVLDQSGSMEGDKLDSLKKAVSGFVDTINEDAAAHDVVHRIAIVGFASNGDDSSDNDGKWKNTGLFVNGEFKKYITYTSSGYDEVYDPDKDKTYYVMQSDLFGDYAVEVSYDSEQNSWGYLEDYLIYEEWVKVTPKQGANDTDESHTQFYEWREGGSQGLTDQDYQDALVSSGEASIKTAISKLSASGATRASYGMEMANNVFANNELRKGSSRVVVFFTDGEPGRNGYNHNEAGRAIAQAHTTKNNPYNAKVFSVGMFDKDPSTKVKNFMNHVSSNYPDANASEKWGSWKVTPGDKADTKYYMTVENDNLSDVFETISGSILNPNVAADASTVLTDKLSQYFDFDGVSVDENGTVTGVTVKKVAYDGNGKWASDGKDITEEVTVGLNGKTVTVKGFDYSDEKNVVTDTPSGYKLVVTFNVKPDTNCKNWTGSKPYETNNDKATLANDGEKPFATVASPKAFVDTYKVEYRFDETAPNGVNPPVDSRYYISGQQATVQQPGNPDNTGDFTYTFNGWTNDGNPVGNTVAIDKANVELIGTWTKTANTAPYTVNYLEKGTNKVLHEKSGTENIGAEIQSADEIITINGYNYDSADKEKLTIGTGENVINIYYTKKTDLSYKVNYLEKGTNNVLHEQKVQNGMTFNATVTSSDEVIDIDGYNYDSVDKDTLTIGTGENVINIYYTKKTDLSYKVNYLEKGTNKVLHTQKTQNGMTFEDVITSANEVIDIDGYNYDSVDKNSLTIGTGENVINIYYTKRGDLSYTVHYYLKGTTQKVANDKTVGSQTLDTVVTEKAIQISGYRVDGSSEKSITIGTGTNEIIFYYTRIRHPSTPTKPTVEIEDDDALGLNTTDHFAYIVGYGNGEVRPQNNITRAEVATIFFRLLTDDVRDENLTKTNRYSDVAATSWYNTAVSTLSSMGIITGYPDGTFRPNAAITRAEFAAIAARFDNDGDKTAAKFSDIASHWAKDEISIAYNNGWITGYPDGTFGPQRDITRAETMTLVNRVLNRQPETEDDLLPNMTVWTDNANPNAWYYLAVQEATNSHYYKFKTNSKYEKWTELRETRDWTLLEK